MHNITIYQLAWEDLSRSDVDCLICMKILVTYLRRVTFVIKNQQSYSFLQETSCAEIYILKSLSCLGTT